MLRLFEAAFVALLVGGTIFQAAAASAPAGLRDKTIHVSYTASAPARTETGRQVSTSRAIAWTIYVSSAGRIFAKVHHNTRRNTFDAARGPDQKTPYSRFEFSGQKLVHVNKMGNHAYQWTLIFDGSFTSCSLHVVSGVEPGTVATWKGMDGRHYTKTGPSVFSNETCSIAPGNAFSN